MTTPRHAQPPLNGQPPAGHPYYGHPPVPPGHPVHNMWTQGRGPAVPPPYRPLLPPPPPAAAAKKPRNRQAVAALLLAAAGILLFTAPVLRLGFGVAAAVLGVLADRWARRNLDRQSRLGLLGALVGALEAISVIAA